MLRINFHHPHSLPYLTKLWPALIPIRSELEGARGQFDVTLNLSYRFFKRGNVEIIPTVNDEIFIERISEVSWIRKMVNRCDTQIRLRRRS